MPSRKQKPKNVDSRGHFFGGVQAVKESLRAKHVRVKKILCTSSAIKRGELKELKKLAESMHVPMTSASPAELDRLLNGINHQGVACFIDQLPQVSFEELCQAHHNLLALDRVQDPHNLGAIIRSANGAGIGGILCPKDRSVGLTATAIKTSAGAALHTPVTYVTNLARALDELKENGFQVIVMQAPDSMNTGTQLTMLKEKLHSPWVLVVGNEATGVRSMLVKRADYVTYLPMQGAVESLNVSTATAVALFTLSC